MCHSAAYTLIFLHAARCAMLQPIPALETYLVDPGSISVSGLSSGACFAVQFHVAYSKSIVGAAIIAGVPFYCAQDKKTTALDACKVAPDLINVTTLVDITHTVATDGLIDDPQNMADDKVYLFSGTLDTVVVPGVVVKLAEYYSTFLTGPHASLEEVFTIPAVHSMVTDDYGNACGTLHSPYINNCSYSTAYHILQHIYGNISPANSRAAIPQNLLEYDQSEFFPGGPDASSMDTIGYVYVPTACQSKSTVCRLHIALHGCLQGREYMSTTYALNAGYVQVAEVNNIIVLFPQVTNNIPDGSNPNGCWDWWGYTGKNYAYNTGPQMAGVKLMLDRVAGLKVPTSGHVLKIELGFHTCQNNLFHFLCGIVFYSVFCVLF